MKNLFVTLFLLTLPLSVFSQSSSGFSCNVKGQAVDSASGESIPYATISVYKMPGNKVEKRLASDGNGSFSITLSQSGLYNITVQAVSYKLVTHSVEIKEKGTLNIGKIILSENKQEIEAVQVIAMKPLVKVAIDKITYNTESDPDAKTVTVLDMLRKIPMVSVDGDDNIKLKGGTNFKIFLNGKPSAMLNNNAKDVLKSMPASNVKDIEVITSPGAKYDAEGIGAIINIITVTKSNNGYNGSVRASYNTRGSVSTGLYLAMTSGKFSFSTNLSMYSYNQSGMRNTIYRENFASTNSHYSYWDGQSKYKGMSPWGDGQASYEIDSLNLITAAFNFWAGSGSSTSVTDVNIQNNQFVRMQQYKMSIDNSYLYGGPEGNIDYQHISKRNKEEIFTLSYKGNYNPNNNKNTSDFENIYNYIDSHQKTKNEAHSTEHTIQADYTFPVTKNQKIETGVKGIFRINSSKTDYYTYNNGDYVYNSSLKNDLDYDQYIYAAYLSYSINFSKFGFKGGLRAEDSKNDGTVTSQATTNFSNKNLEYVPSLNLSYQITPSQTIKTSYSMSIQRPNIWYLNPYVDNSDPKNISYGNPQLNPEKIHNIDLSYSNFNNTTNLNISLYYNFSNNGIDNIITVKGDTSISTYANIAKRHTFGSSVYGSLKIGQKFNININGTAVYNKAYSNQNSSFGRSGWGGNISADCRYIFDKGFSVSSYGGYYFPEIGMQYKGSSFYYYSLNLNKELLNKKMNISLSANQIFTKNIDFYSYTYGTDFYQTSHNYRPRRSVSITLSYKFGKMETQVKRVQRGINNDDVKSGGKSSNGGN
jgi:outer membrane receptor protein involved in Fe transport